MPNRFGHLTVDDDIEAVRRRLVGKLIRQSGTIGIVNRITTRAEYYGGGDPEDDALVMHIERGRGESRRYVGTTIEIWGE